MLSKHQDEILKQKAREIATQYGCSDSEGLVIAVQMYRNVILKDGLDQIAMIIHNNY